MSKFGERLKELREDKGLLNKDLAKAINVEPATITNWEKGNRSPKEDVLIKIADYFNCSLDYLLGRTDNKSSKLVTGKFNDNIVEVEIDKNYPYDLTPEDVEQMLNQLKAVGLNIETLIENSKKK